MQVSEIGNIYQGRADGANNVAVTIDNFYWVQTNYKL